MNMRNIAMITSAFALTIGLTGCVSIPSWTVKPTDLKTQVQADSPFYNNIGIGKVTDETKISVWSKSHSYGSVVVAIQKSLPSVGYLAPAGKTPSYMLDATLLESETTGTCSGIFGPLVTMWFKPVTKIAVNYTLKDVSGETEVYNKTVRSEGMGKDNMHSNAQINAARLNVQEFLDDITSAAQGK